MLKSLEYKVFEDIGIGEEVSINYKVDNKKGENVFRGVLQSKTGIKYTYIGLKEEDNGVSILELEMDVQKVRVWKARLGKQLRTLIGLKLGRKIKE